MEPHIGKGDLVFVMEEERFAGAGATVADGESTGVVTYRTGQETGYTKFTQPGDVIVFRPDGSGLATPIIHRAMFWVEDGENWFDRADPDAVGRYEACETDDDPETDTGLPGCPAPHSGFITKGDNDATNGLYDQVAGIAGEPVRPDWIVGTAEFRIPLLGHVRLLFGLLGGPVGTLATALAASAGGVAFALGGRTGGGGRQRGR
jgi:signal peptidase